MTGHFKGECRSRWGEDWGWSSVREVEIYKKREEGWSMWLVKKRAFVKGKIDGASLELCVPIQLSYMAFANMVNRLLVWTAVEAELVSTTSTRPSLCV